MKNYKVTINFTSEEEMELVDILKRVRSSVDGDGVRVTNFECTEVSNWIAQGKWGFL